MDENIVNENEDFEMFLTFLMTTEIYAVSLYHVLEIIDMQRVTNVPDTPHYIKGVINLRGKVVPVLDVRLRFGLEERDYDERTCIIVVSIGEVSTGLIVDAVDEVKHIPEATIDITHSGMRNNGDKYIAGLGKINGEVNIILDIAKLLDISQTKTSSELAS